MLQGSTATTKESMNLNHRMRTRRLRLIGIALLCDALVFVVSLLLLIIGRFGNIDWIYYPIVLLCIVPLGLGWILSAFHLFTSPADESYKSQWWGRLLFSGPIGPGWYLASLKDD
jgi:hypothetical protein